MSSLKPIGSEKLQGHDKIKRIMEIARFNEVTPNSINETSRSDYSITLADGNNYQIIKEKQGYIIKKTISESKTDYIEPMKNRKYYSSYSQAFKRLNLLAGELNRLNENEEGVSLFGEQKKFVLKTPKPTAETPAPAAPPVEPPAVPSPELPPSPLGAEGGVAPEGEMGTDMGTDMGGEMDINMDVETPEGGMDTEIDMGVEGSETGGDEAVTFKTIQKLTGKLTQKIRTLENEQGMTSEDIKYVINMVLSSFDLGSLSEEDKEDILSKFDETEDLGDEGMGGMEDLGGEDMGTNEMGGESELGVEMPTTEPELGEGGSMGAIFDSIFGESKVDKVISKYFEMTKKEILENKEKNLRKKTNKIVEVKNQMKEVVKLTEFYEQKIASKKFLEENPSAKIVGKTNKNNLVFEIKGRQIKISPKGMLI